MKKNLILTLLCLLMTSVFAGTEISQVFFSEELALGTNSETVMENLLDNDFEISSDNITGETRIVHLFAEDCSFRGLELGDVVVRFYMDKLCWVALTFRADDASAVRMLVKEILDEREYHYDEYSLYDNYSVFRKDEYGIYFSDEGYEVWVAFCIEEEVNSSNGDTYYGRIDLPAYVPGEQRAGLFYNLSISKNFLFR